ncbi:hypothetical protein J14TS5_46770 [Paenibacillus lautus]|nr:hypothetical protein J14TS5_46770 [Paenibacillus lautus]
MIGMDKREKLHKRAGNDNTNSINVNVGRLMGSVDDVSVCTAVCGVHLMYAVCTDVCGMDLINAECI